MPVHAFETFIHGYFFSAAAKAVWDDRATLQRWLDVEAALAQAQADLGLIPQAAASEIARQSRAELFDFERMAREIAFMQHPLVPVLNQLAALCEGEAGGYVHWGATTQNIVDTAVALQLRQTQGLLLERLERVEGLLVALTEQHRDTLMAGRTHGQHALPMTFGFKLAAWLSELGRQRERFRAVEPRVMVATLGGAIGTLASMEGAGLRVQARLAEILGLRAAPIPVRTAYDGLAEYVGLLGLLSVTLEKIAGEIAFMQRTEIAEAEEPFYDGKVGSSTMPQKRNPSRSMHLVSLGKVLRSRVGLILEASITANEGDTSASSVFDMTIGECAVLAVSMLENTVKMLDGLTVHPQRMRRNLELSQGLILAEAVMMHLAPHIGRHEAHEAVYHAAMQAVEQGRSFSEMLLAQPLIQGRVNLDELERILDPRSYLGSTEESIRLVLQMARREPQNTADEQTSLGVRR